MPSPTVTRSAIENKHLRSTGRWTLRLTLGAAAIVVQACAAGGDSRAEDTPTTVMLVPIAGTGGAAGGPVSSAGGATAGSNHSGGSGGSGGSSSGSGGSSGSGSSGSSGSGSSGSGSSGSSGSGSGGSGSSSSSGGSGGSSSKAGSGGTPSSSGGGAGADPAGVVWMQASLTEYESYPAPGSPECVQYSGCLYEGQFAALPGKQSEAWVMAHNIVSVHSKEFAKYELKTLRLRKNAHEIDVVVYDECADSDCSGCCTQNAKPSGHLLDLEKYTAQRFGVPADGQVEWRCLDCP